MTDQKGFSELWEHVSSLADELDFTLTRQNDTCFFSGGYTGQTASFPATVSGLNDAIVWLEQQAEEYEL